MHQCGMEDLCPDGKSVSLAADEIMTTSTTTATTAATTSSASPSKGPTTAPTRFPTHSPSESPTRNPTKSPTRSPSKSPTRNPTQNPTSTTAASDDGRWFPDTVDGVATCRYSSDYPEDYGDYGWLFTDDMNEEGEVVKSGEQKCCEKWSLSCKSKFKERHWYPTSDSTGDRYCAYDNKYGSSFTFENNLLFHSEVDCCEYHDLSHCFPTWFPRISDSGVKECVYE